VGNIDVDQAMIDFYIGDNWAPGGYLWIFPKGDGMANIGLGINGIYGKTYHPHDMIHTFLKQYFPTASMLTSVCGGIPLGKTLKKITAKGLMLTGDAAHMVNPVTGGGIITGMEGGQIAGDVAGQCIQSGDYSEHAMAAYPKRWDKAEGKNHEALYRIAQGIAEITDDQLNRIAHRLVKTPSENLSLLKIFTAVAREKPKMLLDVTRAFAGV
jgi:digeranylgeranylglycerophospholipid reductase